jgi:prepilin-type N-terminal cleavage/methylation domain-containing protein
MTHGHVRNPLARARQAMRKRMAATTPEDSEGFTLIELVVVVAILPLVVGGITVALLSVFSLQHSVSNRISDSNDALVASSVFNRDVQSAQMLTTYAHPADAIPYPTGTVPASSPACGSATQTQLLGLEWGANPAFAGGYQTVVSYVQTAIPNPTGTATVEALDRQVCSNGAASTGYTTQRVSSDIGTPPPPQFSPASAATNASLGWISTLGLTSVTMNVTEPGADQSAAGGATPTASDNYKFSLVGLPGAATSNGTPSDPSQDTSGQCSFATHGTGTYANQLCFVDFSDLSNGAATPAVPNPSYCGSSTPLFMKMGITKTADTLEFCVTESGANVAPAAIPTYYAAGGIGTSEAFLGNNGFYTGVSGNPALYQTQGGTSTVTFSNVQVLDSSGHPASNWTMVTGDAETTDPNEWMDYTSNLNWAILPNSGASNLWGNACYDSAATTNPYSGVWAWTGAAQPTNPPATANRAPLNTLSSSTGFTTGVKSILCESSTSLNKTGTLMLQAQEPQNSTAPQSITVTMYGSGLEALFLAVLL